MCICAKHNNLAKNGHLGCPFSYLEPVVKAQLHCGGLVIQISQAAGDVFTFQINARHTAVTHLSVQVPLLIELVTTAGKQLKANIAIAAE